MLPTIDALPPGVVRKKGSAGCTMTKPSRSCVPNKAAAAMIEPIIYDAILLAVIIDAQAAKIIATYAQTELARRALPKRGRPHKPDGVLDSMASANLAKLPRLAR